MKTVQMIKIAASSLVLGSGILAVGPVGAGIASAASDSAQAREGAAAFRKAASLLKKQKYAKAVAAAETAVGFDPSRAEYRMVLGQAYMGAGRLASAEQAFADTLNLDPANARAGLNRALMQTALGRSDAALTTLDSHREHLAAADFGLAVALAGDTAGAVKVLEAAARAPGADAKTRQNLALAYALDGQWAMARTAAAQDLSAQEIDARMTEWARFSRPGTASDQVASLMNIRPVADPGQPQRLALVQPAAQVAAVEAPAPLVEPVIEPVAASEPVAEFEVASAPVEAPAPLIQAQPEPVRQAVVPVKAAEKVRPFEKAQGGRYVVQLGAYSNARMVEYGWNRNSSRLSELENYTPQTARVVVRGATFYRLSVSGFATRESANRVCTRVKASGGTCFVRSIAGDQPLQWVRRGGPTRIAARR